MGVSVAASLAAAGGSTETQTCRYTCDTDLLGGG